MWAGLGRGSSRLGIQYQLEKDDCTSENQGGIQRNAGSKLVVVYFFADWCPECKKVEPVWEKMRSEQESSPDVAHYRVDVNENEFATEYYNVVSMPTFILFRNGSKIERLVGGDVEALKSLITRHCER